MPKELEDYKENVLLVCNGIQLNLKKKSFGDFAK